MILSPHKKWSKQNGLLLTICLVCVASIGCGKTNRIVGRSDANAYLDSGESEGNNTTIPTELYVVCDPVHKRPGPCIAETYRDGAGAPDNRLTNSYDQNGNLIVSEWDSNADGIIDTYSTYSYDDEGNRLSEDSIGNWYRRYSYDKNGNLVKEEFRRDPDATEPDSIIQYTYDDKNNLLEEIGYDKGEYAPYMRTVYVYDDDSNLVLKQEYQHFCIDWTVPTPTTISVSTTFVTDEHGNTIVEERDGAECEVADGEVDQRIERDFDEDGNVLEVRIDGENDGIVDSISENTYDEKGNRILFETYRKNNESSEYIMDESMRSTYDSHGNRITVERVVIVGANSDVFRSVYSYDEDCNLLTVDQVGSFENPTRTVQHRELYSYDCWE